MTCEKKPSLSNIYSCYLKYKNVTAQNNKRFITYILYRENFKNKYTHHYLTCTT